jgi:hypothetical protein
VTNENITPAAPVVQFEPPELQRLANQSELERAFWMPKRAKELDIPLPDLQHAVAAVVRQKTKEAAAKAKEERRIEQRTAAKEKQETKMRPIKREATTRKKSQSGWRRKSRRTRRSMRPIFS